MRECPEGFVTRLCTVGDFILRLEVTAETDPARPFWALQDMRHLTVAKIYTDDPSNPVITNRTAIGAEELLVLIPKITEVVAEDTESFNKTFKRNIELLKKCS